MNHYVVDLKLVLEALASAGGAIEWQSRRRDWEAVHNVVMLSEPTEADVRIASELCVESFFRSEEDILDAMPVVLRRLRRRFPSVSEIDLRLNRLSFKTLYQIVDMLIHL
jgi:hypothetical protein